jgi:hypothetical protein
MLIKKHSKKLIRQKILFSRISCAAILSVLLGKGFCVVGWVLACLLMSLLPIYKRTAVIDRIDNIYSDISIHKIKKVREIILSHYHCRITIVFLPFLPIKSPELNLIEVRWICECKEKLYQ